MLPVGTPTELLASTFSKLSSIVRVPLPPISAALDRSLPSERRMAAPDAELMRWIAAAE